MWLTSNLFSRKIHMERLLESISDSIADRVSRTLSVPDIFRSLFYTYYCFYFLKYSIFVSARHLGVLASGDNTIFGNSQNEVTFFVFTKRKISFTFFSHLDAPRCYVYKENFPSPLSVYHYHKNVFTENRFFFFRIFRTFRFG